MRRFNWGMIGAVIGAVGIIVTTFIALGVIRPLDNKDGAKELNKTTQTKYNNKYEKKARTQIIAIGVSDYKYIPDLFFAVRDAQNVAAYFNESRGYSVSGILLGPNSTKQGMHEFVKSMLYKTQDSDQLIVYISLRGISVRLPGKDEEYDAYLLPYDIDVDLNTIESEELFYKLQKRGYSLFSLLTTLDQMAPRNLLLLIDASREFFNHFGNQQMQIDGSTRQVIAGSREGLLSCELKDYKSGSLAYSLLKILSKTDIEMQCDQLGVKICSEILTHLPEKDQNHPSFIEPWVGLWNGKGSFTIRTKDSVSETALDNIMNRSPSIVFPSIVSTAFAGKPSLDLQQAIESYLPQPTGVKYTEIPIEYKDCIRALQRDSEAGIKRKRAFEFAHQKLKENEYNQFAHWMLAELYLSDKNKQQLCREHALKAIKIDSSLAEPYGVLGLYNLNKGNWEAAMKYLDEGVIPRPDSSLAWHTRSYCLRKYAWSINRNLSHEIMVEMTRDSIAAASKALEFANDLVGTEVYYIGNMHFNRGRGYHQIGELENAIKDYTESLNYKCSRYQRADRKKYLQLAREGK